jgi:hypothetical protein
MEKETIRESCRQTVDSSTQVFTVLSIKPATLIVAKQKSVVVRMAYRGPPRFSNLVYNHNKAIDIGLMQPTASGIAALLLNPVLSEVNRASTALRANS